MSTALNTALIGKVRSINEAFAGHRSRLKHLGIGSVKYVIVVQPNLKTPLGSTVLQRDGSLGEGLQRALEVPQGFDAAAALGIDKAKTMSVKAALKLLEQSAETRKKHTQAVMNKLLAGIEITDDKEAD